MFFHKIKQCSAEGVTQESEVEVSNASPHRGISNTAFRDKSMNMRIPLQTATECMENADKTGTKVLRFINFIEHTKDNIANGSKERVQKSAVFSEENAKFFRNSKDTMSVRTLNQFKRHIVCSTDRVKITAGSAEATFTTERDKLKFTAIRAFIDRKTFGGITALKHSIDIIKDSGTNSNTAVSDFIEIISENLL